MHSNDQICAWKWVIMCSWWVIFVEVARNFDLRLLLRGENFLTGEIIKLFYCANRLWLFTPGLVLSRQARFVAFMWITRQLRNDRRRRGLIAVRESSNLMSRLAFRFSAAAGQRVDDKSCIQQQNYSPMYYRLFHSAGKVENVCFGVTFYCKTFSDFCFELKLEQFNVQSQG